jgi:hypothetical protein|tara:strand:+ start:322 stop:483 length:162 start_codon:yes stop_codon:yes gene_type:complete
MPKKKNMKQNVVIQTDIVYRITGQLNEIIDLDEIPNKLKAEALKMELAKLEIN